MRQLNWYSLAALGLGLLGLAMALALEPSVALTVAVGSLAVVLAVLSLHD